MTALKALKALKTTPDFKASKRRNQPFLTALPVALKALKYDGVSKPPKNPIKSSFEALKALNPPTGGSALFKARTSPAVGPRKPSEQGSQNGNY